MSFPSIIVARKSCMLSRQDVWHRSFMKKASFDTSKRSLAQPMLLYTSHRSHSSQQNEGEQGEHQQQHLQHQQEHMRRTALKKKEYFDKRGYRKNVPFDVRRSVTRKSIELSHAPSCVDVIRDYGYPRPNDAAFIRSVGCTRRVFIFHPYFTSDELASLAYRIRALSSNEGINSVLIATDGTEHVNPLAISSTQRNDDNVLVGDEDYFYEDHFSPEAGKTYHVSSGYDPLALYKSGAYKSQETVSTLLNRLSQLANAVRGDKLRSKVPVISVPHGAICDGGFALCTASYVIATPQTCYRILNPSRGLSLDPVGLSYFLPRAGQEFKQPTNKYSKTISQIIGLMGLEIDANDMLSTGLATHYISSVHDVGVLETGLAYTPPWVQQNPLRTPTQYYGDPEPTDHNAKYRNETVAGVVYSATDYNVARSEMWGMHDKYHDMLVYDPSVCLDPPQWHQWIESTLIDYAVAFDPIFKSESTIIGLFERLNEIAFKRIPKTPSQQRKIDLAADFVNRMQKQSPFALSVVYQLLQMGARKNETLQTCMTRERDVQTKMFAGEDFRNWAKFQITSKSKDTFHGWKHKSLADVNPDEVLEFIGS